MTNADKIRSMTDEELGELIADLVDHQPCFETGCKIKCAGFCRYPDYGCDENALVWLRQEASEDA